MNALTTQQPSTLPPNLPKPAADALTAILSRSERVNLELAIPASMTLLDSQRAYLARHADRQDLALLPAEVGYARIEVAAMFDVMKIRSADERTLAERIEIYAGDLAALPAFALSQACADFRRGVTGDGEWAPTPGEIRKRALAIAEPIAKERANIRSVLAAKIAPERPVNESRRAAALAFARQVADEMRVRPDPLRKATEYRVPTRQEATEWLEREKANPYAPAISDALRASLKLPEQENAA